MSVQGQVKAQNRHFSPIGYRDGNNNSCELKLCQKASQGMKNVAYKYGPYTE